MRIQLISLGVGNIGSVSNYLRWLGFTAQACENPSDEPLVICGVASLKGARTKTLKQLISERHKKRLKTIAICAGFQLLFGPAEEAETENNIGLLSMPVKAINKNRKTSIGYFEIKSPEEEYGTGYFCHTFGVEAEKVAEFSIATVSCDEKNLIALLKDEYILGMQFHPEKSPGFNHESIKHFLDK